MPSPSRFPGRSASRRTRGRCQSRAWFQTPLWLGPTGEATMALIQASDMDFYAYATRDLEPGEELTLPYGRPAGRPDHALFHYGFLPGGAGAAGAPPPLAALDLPGGGLHDTPTFSEEDHRAPAPAAPALAPGRISRALSACPCRSCAGAASALHLLGGSPYVMAPPRAPQSSAAARLHSGCRCPRRTRTARSASAAPVRQLRSRQAGLCLGRAAERTARRGVWTWQVWRQMARAALRRWAAACAAGLRVVPRLAGGVARARAGPPGRVQGAGSPGLAGLATGRADARARAQCRWGGCRRMRSWTACTRCWRPSRPPRPRMPSCWVRALPHAVLHAAVRAGRLCCLTALGSSAPAELRCHAEATKQCCVHCR